MGQTTETFIPADGFSVDAAEVARFSALADKWWDTKGPFKPLHIFNPTRVGYIRDQVALHKGRDTAKIHAFEGLKLLDIGCGGGLLSEPMRRMGFEVTAIDASAQNIGAASAHAQRLGLDITYRNITAETLLEEAPAKFDVVLTMEVIEHVADPARFLNTCFELVAPGGLMFVATLNRTLKAHALAIVGAEYILRWLPVGTHDWSKFLKPEEIKGFLQPVLDQGRAEISEPQGVSYNPLFGTWSLSNDTDINYMMVVQRRG